LSFTIVHNRLSEVSGDDRLCFVSTYLASLGAFRGVLLDKQQGEQGGRRKKWYMSSIMLRKLGDDAWAKQNEEWEESIVSNSSQRLRGVWRGI
jgi:hypothetical protein